MKIDKITVFYPEQPYPTVGVRVYTDEGIYGDGDVCGVSTGYAAVGALRDIAPNYIGRNPLDNEVLWDQMLRTSAHLPVNSGLNGGQALYAAVSAMDIALWDIKGKYFKLPIWQLLGGKKREKLRAYASQLMMPWDDSRKKSNGSFLSKPEDIAEECRYCVEELGFDAVKVDVTLTDENGKWISEEEHRGLLRPDYLDLIERRVAAVRAAIGKKADIILENHCYTDAVSGIQIAKRVEKYGILYYEEPCMPNAQVTNYVSKAINIPIAHGERLVTRWDYAPFFRDNSLSIIQPDLGNCGGITEGKKICDMAYVYDTGVQLHTAGSHIQVAAALHLEAVLPNFAIHETHVAENYENCRAVTTKHFDPVKGSYSIPDEPGLGTEWSDELLSCKEQFTID